MLNLGSHEIRDLYLDFFKEKGHLIRDSFSLVPKNDASLLLINAGMAPLKPYFLGTQVPPSKRMANCQKCIRTDDIENVGRTSRHGTFFEMLGNFSFGDYFKKESIEWSWEFMTEVLKIDKDDLWVSVYYEDDETYDIWNKEIGVDESRLVRLGKEDNFWELEVGPSGPCTEIYIDRGVEVGCGNEDCLPGCECDRFLEVWNLVFSEFNKDEEGNYTPLKSKNIDTGMGLERITAVLQNKDNIFEIDTMKEIIAEIERITDKKYEPKEDNAMSFRVITDHIRAMTFLISDGIIPSNEGRGYILRRLIRRAARHGKLLGLKDLFLNELSSKVIDSWGDTYEELRENNKLIQRVIKAEEEKFEETIHQGIGILNDYIEEMSRENKTELDGEDAFKLYDTYGFPLDLTKEILEEQNLDVDEEEFNREMEEQRNRARKARKNSGIQSWDEDIKVEIDKDLTTIFEGYERLSTSTKVTAIVSEGKSVDELEEGQEGIMLLEKTPFYAEGGGQEGDTGEIFNTDVKIKVLDTVKGEENQYLHMVKLTEGKVKVGSEVTAVVDGVNRMSIARNHSVTHLLHQALKDVIGDHVNQAGSLVQGERLRFDFTHFEAVTKEQLSEIEDIVNSKILDALNVEVVETTIEDAKEQGAQALFDEKYGDKVRLVKIGDYSSELCGGTHVDSSSQIGLFKILSESGIAAGVRRIEAITGSEAYNYVKNIENQIDEVSEMLKTNKNDVMNKMQNTLDENKSLEKEIEKLKSELTLSKLDDILEEVSLVEDVHVICKVMEDSDGDDLRQLGDKLRDKLDSVLVVLGSTKNDKVSLIAMATKDLVDRGIHSGNIIREVAKVTGGGGGGRPDMAQAGGKDASKIEEALDMVPELIKSQLK